MSQEASQDKNQILKFLAEHGANFIEEKEAGYTPAYEKARKSQEKLIQGAAQATGGTTLGAQVVQQEQRAAVKTAAKALKYESTVEKLYRQGLDKINTMYTDTLNKIHEEYQELASKGVSKVLVDTNGDGKPDKEMTLREWLSYALDKLENWRKKALESLEEWRRNQSENLQAYLLDMEEKLAEWKKKSLGIIEQVEKAYSKAREAWEKAYSEWLTKLLAAARRATSRQQAEKLADQAYREAKQYWARHGLSEKDAEKRAQQAKQQVYQAALQAAEKAEQLKTWLQQKYNSYAKALATLALQAGMAERQGGFRREIERIVEEFRQQAAEKAKELGVPPDTAEQLIQPYLDALEETGTENTRIGTGAKIIQGLYNTYAERIKAAKAPGEPGKLVQEFMEKAQAIAKKYGVASSYVDSLAGKLEQLASTISKTIEAGNRARSIYETYIHEFARNPPFYYMNLDVFSKKLHDKILGELVAMGVDKKYAGGLADYYTQLYVKAVTDWMNKTYAALPRADFICEQTGPGLFCKVYRNGQYVRSFTVSRAFKAPSLFAKPSQAALSIASGGRSFSPEFYATLAEIGYKPAHMWIARSDEEMKRIELAYLREKNPKEYMARIGKKAFTWQGGLSPKDIYKNLKQFTTYAEEFYKLPSEKLMEKAEKTSSTAEKLGLGALAAAGLLGAGALAGAAEAWNIPGVVEFGKQLASGQLARAVARNPAVEAPYMAGALLGGSYALGKIAGAAGSLAGKISPPLSSAVPRAMGAGLMAATLYGAATAKKHGFLPLAAAPLVAALAKEKAAEVEEETGKQVELPLDKAIRLIEEGKAEPELEIGGERYVYARLRTGAGEQPALVPEEAWEKAIEEGDLEELSRLLGRRVLAVKPGGPGSPPEVYASLSPEEAEALYKQYTNQLLEEPEAGEEEGAEETGPETEETPGEENTPRPEYRAEGIAEFLRQAEKELEEAEKETGEPKPVYPSEYQLPTGEKISLGEVLETLTKPEAGEEAEETGETGRPRISFITHEELMNRAMRKPGIPLLSREELAARARYRPWTWLSYLVEREETGREQESLGATAKPSYGETETIEEEETTKPTATTSGNKEEENQGAETTTITKPVEENIQPSTITIQGPGEAEAPTKPETQVSTQAPTQPQTTTTTPGTETIEEEETTKPTATTTVTPSTETAPKETTIQPPTISTATAQTPSYTATETGGGEKGGGSGGGISIPPWLIPVAERAGIPVGAAAPRRARAVRERYQFT